MYRLQQIQRKKEKSKGIEGKRESWMAEQSQTGIAILEGNGKRMKGQRSEVILVTS